jgi:hypothetical protein
MSIPPILGFNPIWYIADLTGKPLGGGFLVTQSSLNPEVLKPVYTDATGLTPQTYVQVTNQPAGRVGILFGLNGQAFYPLYFTFDPAFPSDGYFLQVYDSNGALVWTVDDYFPPSGGGGGEVIVTVTDLENFIVNNVMYRNIGENPISTTQMMRLAPGAHSGIASTTTTANTLGGSLPDVYFLKNNLNATDTIAFPKFTYGDTPFDPDSTPVDYLEYSCTAVGTGEVQKCVQFPITQGASNLSNLNVTVAIYARATSGSNITLSLFFRQFFGDGSSYADVLTPVGAPLALEDGWQKFVVTGTIPSVFTKVPGDCGNDSLYLLAQFPFTTLCTIDFTKPALYAFTQNSATPFVDYHSYDMIDASINAPRTGYVFGSYDLVSPPGYVMLDDTTIGDSMSGAAHIGKDYFPLYNWLWTNVSNPSTNANCIVRLAGTPNIGVSAVADFMAHKTIDLPKALGRVFSGSGTGSGLTNKVIGSFDGEQSHEMTEPELATHSHPGSTVSINHANNAAAGASRDVYQPSLGVTVTLPLTITPDGNSRPFNVIQPTSYLNYFIKL